MKITGKITEKTSTSGTTKTGKPWTRTALVVADNKLSTFEAVNFEVGNAVEVEFVEKDGYKNIVSIFELQGEAPVEKVGVAMREVGVAMREVGKDKAAQSPPLAGKNVSIYTSYAKDIFVSLQSKEGKDNSLPMVELMNMSIELVKQARKAFE